MGVDVVAARDVRGRDGGAYAVLEDVLAGPDVPEREFVSERHVVVEGEFFGRVAVVQVPAPDRAGHEVANGDGDGVARAMGQEVWPGRCHRNPISVSGLT